MAMTDMVNAADMERAMKAFAAPGSFNHDKFFEMMKMKRMPTEQLIRVFNMLDVNQDGFIDRIEIQDFLILVMARSRKLTELEINEFLKAGDTDGDGRISFEEFEVLVYS